MRKVLLVILILVAIALAIIPARKKDTTEVVFWTLQMGDFSEYMNDIIERFQISYPYITIKWVDVPFSEGEKRTLASILSDNPPDLVNLNPDFSALLAQKEALAEINSERVGQFNPRIINALKYQGKLYSIPWYATSAVTIYNKKLLQQSGVILPQTYEQMGKIAPYTKKCSGAYVFMPTITENDTMLKILNKYGINSPQTINSKEAVRIFDFYKELYQKDLIPKETVTQTHREALEKYMSESVVFFQGGSNFLNLIKENSPETYKNTAVASQFKGTLGQNDFSLMNFVIPLRAKNKEEALKFALFLTNEENQMELARLTNVLPAERHALKNDYFTYAAESDLAGQARVISAKQLNNIEPVLKQSNAQKEVNLLVNTTVQQILMDKTDTKKALDEVSAKWSELLK